jgi:hypothetical protein
MKNRILPGFVVLLVAGGISAADDKQAVSPEHARNTQEGLALFRAKVRPVLVKQCLDCHGGKATKGDLDLSDRELLMKSGALEGGSKESRLALSIRHEDEPHMPQKAAKLPTRRLPTSAAGSIWEPPTIVRSSIGSQSRSLRSSVTPISGRFGRWLESRPRR